MLAVTGAQQPDVYGVWQSGYSAVCQWPAWNPTVRWRHKWDLHYNNNPMKYSVCARRHHMTARSSALLFTATICLLSDSSYHGRTQTCLAHGSDFVETETDSSCCTVNKCCHRTSPSPHCRVLPPGKMISQLLAVHSENFITLAVTVSP